MTLSRCGASQFKWSVTRRAAQANRRLARSVQDLTAAGLAVCEGSITLLHPSTFSRCFNRDGERVSAN